MDNKCKKAIIKLMIDQMSYKSAWESLGHLRDPDTDELPFESEDFYDFVDECQLKLLANFDLNSLTEESGDNQPTNSKDFKTVLEECLKNIEEHESKTKSSKKEPKN